MPNDNRTEKKPRRKKRRAAADGSKIVWARTMGTQMRLGRGMAVPSVADAVGCASEAE